MTGIRNNFGFLNLDFRFVFTISLPLCRQLKEITSQLK